MESPLELKNNYYAKNQYNTESKLKAPTKIVEHSYTNKSQDYKSASAQII